MNFLSINSNMSSIKFPLLLVFFLLTNYSIAQQNHNNQLNSDSLNWFVEVSAGTQMSGIKSEDFVRSNYSPLINLTVGRWFIPYLALQIGYKGQYFNQISDDLKHYYNFYYGEALLNMHKLLYPENKRWNLILHVGAGYFYNHTYGQPNKCANIGIQQNFRITEQWQATIDVSSIMGWDIYQGDEDILPGLTLGIFYSFSL
jgi:hypothetical protein